MSVSRYTYKGDESLGQLARVSDPNVDENKPTDMERELGGVYDRNGLDMAPGTKVEVFGHDEERGLVAVLWRDTNDTPRITSIEPDVFAEHFRPEDDS